MVRLSPFLAIKDLDVFQKMTGIYSDAAPGFLISGTCLLIAAALGLTGGIALLCRKRRCVRTVRLWAVLQIIAGAVYAVIQADVQTQLMNATWQSTAVTPPMAMAAPMSIFGAVIGFIFGAALPIFVLVWLARPSIRADCGKW